MEDSGDYNRKFVKDLLKVRRDSKAVLEKGSDPWPVSFTGSADYSKVFSEVFAKYATANKLDVSRANSADFIKDFADEKKREGKAISVLDVMSYGEVIRDLQATGVAIGLTDERTAEMKESDIAHNIKMVTGDIFAPQTWDALDTMYPSGGEFDFILCRPNGAISRIPDNLNIAAYLFKRMYSHLSKDNGILLTEVGAELSEDMYFTKAMREMNAIPGVQAYSGTESFIASTMMLVKGENAPQSITGIEL